MSQLTLTEYDPSARKHGGNAQSRAAHRATRERKRDVYDRILRFLRCNGGGTADEYSACYGVGVNTISGRFTELCELGKIERTGETRRTRTGSRAAVWRVSISAASGERHVIPDLRPGDAATTPERQ